MSNEKKWYKTLLKAVLWLVGIWAALLVILQFTLSEKVLTRLVNRYATEYIDGDISFGSASVSMFKRFPRVFLTLDDFAVTYPADRFDAQEKMGVQGHLMYKGCGHEADTLASFDRFSASINVVSLIRGTIRIPHLVLVQPRIFAHTYANGDSNWDIFISGEAKEEEDTTATVLPDISLGRISFNRHPHIVYTDSRDTVFAMIDVARIGFNGHVRTKSKKASHNRIGLTVDSMFVAGRIKTDTMALALEKFHIHEHKDHMDIDAKAKAMLATNAFGRIHLPIGMSGTLSFPKDTVPAISLSGFKADIGDFPFVADADLRFREDRTGIKAKVGLQNCSLNDVFHGFAKNIIPELEMIETDARLSIMAECDGDYMNKTGAMPMVKASMTMKGNTSGLHIDISGGVKDLMGNDPSVSVDGLLDVSLDTLATMLPDSLGITAAGNLAARIQGSALLSQLSIYNFSRSSMTGKISSEKIEVKIPQDSINVDLKGLDVILAPEEMTSRRDSSRKFRLVGVTATLANADISYGGALEAKVQDFLISAKNSTAENADTAARINPLIGRLKAKRLIVKDAAQTSINLKETDNSFNVFPKKDQPLVPMLTLRSSNDKITLSSGRNRAILTDADLRASAAMNTVERKHKAKRGNRPTPQWMEEDDFKEHDIDIRLDETMAKYFRDWDLKGDIGVRTGIVMTPYFPLTNILRGFEMNFTNNEVKIDSFKVVAGKSQIEAKGSLTGLKRALTGRGRSALRFNLDVYSQGMDANQLLAAYSKGAAYKPETGLSEELSDAELLKQLTKVDTTAVADTFVSPLIVVPANLNANITLSATNVKYSDLVADSITSKIVMKNRCIQITDTKALTNMGTMGLDAFYSTRSKKDIKAGFNLNFNDITADKVINLMPAVDTLMPLLKSFSGLLNCEVAATTALDTNMNLIMPSINGIIRVGGKDLTIKESEMFRSLSRKLLFKNRKEGHIEEMTVEGLIKDNTLEIFPFIVKMDRYMLALSGVQNLDMSYRYHASLIRSPFLIRLGVDVYGPDFDNMKFKIGKAKYKNGNVPVFSSVIDQTKINLVESIHNIFEKGVDAAIKENMKQSAILNHKESIGYVKAVDMKLEELSEDEQKQMEAEQAAEEAAETVAEIGAETMAEEAVTTEANPETENQNQQQ